MRFDRLFERDKKCNAETLDLDDYQHLHVIQRSLTALTYKYDGDMVSYMGGAGLVILFSKLNLLLFGIR